MSKLKLLIICLGAIITILIVANLPQPKVNLSMAKSSTKPMIQDSTLVADAQQLGLSDYQKVNLQFLSDVTMKTGDLSSNISVIGAFVAPDTISIKTGLTKSIELQAVAYEFMHYYWEQLPQSTKDTETPVLQNLYNSDPSFRAITKDFTGSSNTINDERNAAACTKVPPYALSEELNSWCNSFIPNRPLLFN